jgi:hypothetical protein
MEYYNSPIKQFREGQVKKIKVVIDATSTSRPGNRRLDAVYKRCRKNTVRAGKATMRR